MSFGPNTTFVLLLSIVASFGLSPCSNPPEPGTGESDEVAPPSVEQPPTEQAESEHIEESPSPSALEQRLATAAAEVDSDAGYTILFSQDGEPRFIEDRRVILDAQLFEIHVVGHDYLSEYPLSVRINISDDSTHHDIIVAEGTDESPLRTGHRSIDEPPFNEARTIYVDDEHYNFWLYSTFDGEPLDDHNYDTVEHLDDLFIATRTVEFFGIDGENLPVADLAERTMYFIEFQLGNPMEPQPPRRTYAVEFHTP